MYEIIERDITIYNLERFQGKLAELNRIAKRLDLPAITYTMERSVEKHMDDFGIRTEVAVYAVHVVGPRLKIDGWQLVGTLDHEEHLVRPVPGMVVPAQYFEAESYCDHCGANRVRLDTFVIAHDDGKYMQVGRNCLGKYLGINPATALAMADITANFAGLGDDEEMSFGGGSEASAYGLEEFLAYVVMFVNEYGYLGRTAAKDTDNAATADMVWFHFDLLRKGRSEKRANASHYAVAKEVVAWMKQIEPGDSEYLFNLTKIAENDTVSFRSAGYAASAFSAMLREREKALKAEASAGYVGVVGQKKFSTTVTLVGTSGYNTNYGYTLVFKFMDEAGHVIVWTTASSDALQVGARYSIQGTVKGHEVYKSEMQTALIRCKVGLLEDAPVPA